MTDYKSLVKQKLTEWLLPILFVTFSASAIIDCYIGASSNAVSTLFFMYAFLLYAFLDMCFHMKKFKGGMLYFIILVTMILLSLYLINTAYETATVSFNDWFYLSFDSDFVVPSGYMAGLFLGGGFFIISVVFYFTQVRYRAVGTMLILFIPFVIYAKRQDTMSDLRITILLTLYIAVMVHNNQLSHRENKAKTLINKSYVISLAVVVTFVGAVTMFLPKSSMLSKFEEDASIFNAVDISANQNDLSLNDNAKRNHNPEYTNERLFYLYSDSEQPVYLRRQAYNGYDAQYNEWVVTKDVSSNDLLVLPQYGEFSAAYKAIAQLYLDSRYSSYFRQIPDDIFSENYEPVSHSVRIEMEEGKTTAYVPAPLYTDVEYSNLSYKSNEILSDGEDTFEYVYYDELGRIKGFPEKFSMANKTYSRLLLEAIDNIAVSDIGYEYPIDSLYYIDTESYSYTKTYLYNDEYEVIKNLADDITDGCTTSYEKATAIVDYFEDNGFVYDLEYVPADNSVSYFLTESKRGICSDFATAMTLLCQVEGVPARYVEGYLAYERDPENSDRFIIRDSHAHAFVEVYTGAAGWMTFEPTVAGYMQDFSANEQINKVLLLFNEIFGRLFLFIVVILVAVFVIFFDRIAELVFRIRMRFCKENKRTVLLYVHIIKLIEYLSLDDLSAYTSDMLISYCYNKCGASVEKSAKLFERKCFGFIEPTPEEFSEAYAEYLNSYPSIRKSLKAVRHKIKPI